MHYGGFEVDPFYLPVADPIERLRTATEERSYDVRMLEPGESFEPAAIALAG